MPHQWFICSLPKRCCLTLSSLPSSVNQTLRTLLLLLFVFLMVGLLVLSSIVDRAPSSLSASVIRLSRNTTTTTVPPPLFTDIDCKRLGFKRIRSSKSRDVAPPIYDFFLFHDELDLLEIRLYELYSYVALFLIAESRTTLSGKPKPLYLKENWQKFEQYHSKMRRLEIDLNRNPQSYWANEIQAREDGLRLALQNQTEDILLLSSDIDEIPAAHVLHAVSACELPRPFPSLVLICAYYYYSFEYRRKGGTTEGATVTFLSANRTNRTTSPSGKSLRDERFNYRRIPSSCYHCSWCFDRINLTRSKMTSFSHTELNQPRYQTQEHILERYRQGKDLFDRPNEEYIRLKNNKEIPELVKAQRERFAYMWNRSALVNVGFRDVIANKACGSVPVSGWIWIFLSKSINGLLILTFAR